MATDSRARRDVSRPGQARRTLRAVPTGERDDEATVAEASAATLDDRLDGKVALVTGAGSPDGIGYATARRLRALGASVLVFGGGGIGGP